MVVALFRHGIRPPLPAFACDAHDYSGQAWPELATWQAIDSKWGNLTDHGKSLAQALGRHYSHHYRNLIGPGGQGVFLWADVDERTQQTALGLRSGFCSPPRGVSCRVKLDGLFAGSPNPPLDPLFHPFSAGCVRPDSYRVSEHLKRIVDEIQRDQTKWLSEHSDVFQMLQNVLNCGGEVFNKNCGKNPGQRKCVPLQDSPSRDNVALGRSPYTCHKPDCEKPDSDPIKWTGAFSYASSATEAFLLEYANDVEQKNVGWGRINPPNSQQPPNLGKMLQLHEFFFDITQRNEHLAKMQGSNLAREILQDLERGAGKSADGCAHGAADSKFIGLVGHDTNLAALGALLDLHWKFEGESFSEVPPDDALPAGALVFELRDHGQSKFFVRISYVTFAPQPMRDYKKAAADPAWIRVTGANCGDGPDCDIELPSFHDLVTGSLGSDFLSKCSADGRQRCMDQK